MISVFTPSFADENNTNAQNLTVKEIVARLCPEKFRVTMFYEAEVDPRIRARPNTELLKTTRHGNTPRMLLKFLADVPDVYFFPRQGPFDAAVFLTRKHLRLRTRIVTYIVSGGLENGISTKSMARNIYEADVVVGNSSYISEILGHELKMKVPTIFDGVDERYYYPAESKLLGGDSNPDGLVVLTAGSFRSYKRMDLVVKQAVRWPRVKFRLAGHGEEQVNCLQLAKESGCENITFLGHLSQSELGREMREADIFFFPSTLEGHPQVLLQAAACGLPCVARSTYRPEFVLHGITGFLEESDEELGMRLSLLLQDGALRHSMACAALLHIQAFSWDRAAQDWAQLFEATASVRKSRVSI